MKDVDAFGNATTSRSEDTSGSHGLYEELPHGSFRLLRINGDSEGKLHCSIASFPLGTEQDYVAISYTWGPPEEPKFIDKEAANMRQQLRDLVTQRDTWPPHIQHWIDELKLRDDDDTEPAEEDFDERHTIMLNAHPVEIGQNLFDLLQELAGDENSGANYWIDALCINQADDDEKADQVNRMDNIYEAAESVLVWLGRSCKTMPRVLEIIKQLAAVHYHEKEGGRDWKELADIPDLQNQEQNRRLGLEGITNEDWSELFQFYRRRWFSRAWTLQEAALARDLVSRCGSFEIRPHDLIGAAVMLSSTRLEEAMNVEFMTDAHMFTGSGFGLAAGHPHFALLLSGDAQELGFGRTFERWYDLPEGYSSTPALLDYCLSRTGLLHCSDGRDRVFSLLGIVARAAEVYRSVPLEIQADYRKSVIDVYTETMTYILRSLDSLTPLSRVHYPTSLSGKGLPSWVTDLTVMGHCPIIDIPLFQVAHEEPTVTFEASRKTRRGFSIDGGILRASCHQYARITHVSESWQQLSEESSWERLAQLALARIESTPTQELRIDDLWKTMICDIESRFGRELAPDGAMRLSFRAFLAGLSFKVVTKLQLSEPGSDVLAKMCWEELLANIDDSNTIPWPQEALEVARTLDPRMMSMHDAGEVFHDLARKIMTDKRVVLLENGDIGLGSHGVEPGDMLCILADGGKVPFLLRQVVDGCSWKLIGEAYVRGIMYGEAVDQMEKDGKDWEQIYIV